MKYLKKHLSLALALVLCLSLAACGKSSEDYVESNEDYGDDGSDYNLYGVPDSFEGLVKDSEQMANLYLYGGAWTGEDGGTLVAANKRLMLDVDTAKTKEFQLGMLDYIHVQHAELVTKINEEKVLDDAITEQIVEAVKEYKSR